VPLTHTLWSVSDRARHTRCGRSPTEPPRANLDGRAGAVRRPARARHTRCGRSPTEPPRANLDGRASAVRRPARARHTRCGRSPTEPPAGLWLVARARSGDRPEPDTHAAAGLRPSRRGQIWMAGRARSKTGPSRQAGAVRRPPRARHTRCGRSPTEPPRATRMARRARSGDRPEPDTHAAAGL